MIDYHVHLWRHAPHLSLQASVEQLAAYCAQAARLGVTELAVTERSSRFRQFDALVRGWWDQDPSPARRAETSTCWDEELGADLDQYVDTALAAKAAGLPLVLGLEVDYVPGRMGEVGTPRSGAATRRHSQSDPDLSRALRVQGVSGRDVSRAEVHHSSTMAARTASRTLTCTTLSP